MSRSTCAASARSPWSAASCSASARIEAATFRRAASISAVRTAAETGVPSRVNTANAFDVSQSGRKVIVSAMNCSVLQFVRRGTPTNITTAQRTSARRFAAGRTAAGRTGVNRRLAESSPHPPRVSRPSRAPADHARRCGSQHRPHSPSRCGLPVRFEYDGFDTAGVQVLHTSTRP